MNVDRRGTSEERRNPMTPVAASTPVQGSRAMSVNMIATAIMSTGKGSVMKRIRTMPMMANMRRISVVSGGISPPV
jgi:hypothetical protein